MSPHGLRECFETVRAKARKFYAPLGDVRLEHCPLADKEHSKSPRQFMHYNHHPRTICYAKACEVVGEEWLLGLCAHEFGHAFAFEADLEHSEADANKFGGAILGRRVVYEGPLRLERVK